MTNDLSNIINS